MGLGGQIHDVSCAICGHAADETAMTAVKPYPLVQVHLCQFCFGKGHACVKCHALVNPDTEHLQRWVPGTGRLFALCMVCHHDDPEGSMRTLLNYPE